MCILYLFGRRNYFERNSRLSVQGNEWCLKHVVSKGAFSNKIGIKPSTGVTKLKHSLTINCIFFSNLWAHNHTKCVFTMQSQSIHRVCMRLITLRIAFHGEMGQIQGVSISQDAVFANC